MPLNVLQMPIYALSDTTGLVEWIDYIPVQQETAGRAGSTDDDGYLQSVNVLSDNTGLVAWVDYIPVYEVTGRTKPWHTDSTGYIPYDEIGSVAAWTPAALFASGEVGAWYDPSDLDTMFQDSAGTTPVTAVEQSVGLILDKSKGLTLGSELVTNGTFDTDTAWTKTVAEWTISGGTANLAATSVNRAIYQNVVTVANTWYEISFDILSLVGGALTLMVGGVDIASKATTGTFVARALVTGTSTEIRIRNTGSISTTATIDNVSVKALPGTHAYQATAASRPILRARHNLLTYSEEFDNAAWTKVRIGVTANATTAPDGTTTADILTGDGTSGVYQIYSGTLAGVGEAGTFSIYAKAGTGQYLQLTLGGASNQPYANFDLVGGTVTATGNSGTGAIESIGDGWYRCSLYGTSTAASGSGMLFYITGPTNGRAPTITTDATYYVWGAQWNRTTSPGVYQRIAAATDYVTSSTMETYDFPYYLDFDGVDDGLAGSGVESVGEGTYILAGAMLPSAGGGSTGWPIMSSGAITSTGSFTTAIRNDIVRRLLGGMRVGSGTSYVTPALEPAYTHGIPFLLNVYHEDNVLYAKTNQGGPVSIAADDDLDSVPGRSIYLFTISSGGGTLAGRFFGGVIVRKVLSAQEKTDAEAYFAAKSGVTL